MAKAQSLNELNQWYQAADSVDREVYAEMRSNMLLVAGEHYSKASLQVYRAHIRENRDLTDIQRLRITKNHIHRGHRHWVQGLLTYASGTAVSPSTENDMQCMKSAELNEAVWKDAQYRYKIREHIRKWAGDFWDCGEVAVKLFWDPNAGDFIGYAHAQHQPEDPMEPPPDGQTVDEQGFLYDEDGAPVPNEDSPIFSGGFVFERLFGFNIMRDPQSKDMLDSCIGIRKMVSTSLLKARYANDPEKLKFLDHDQNDEFIVFDQTRNGYDRSRGMTLVKEKYWRPGVDYPEGWYCIWTKSGKLEEGPLPFGLFPIVWKGFDEWATTPRGRSLIKQARPFQAEINRASSQQAQAQITIGDDKILYQAGSKLAPGALLPGVRGIAYQGKEPTVLAGRDGGQFLNYILAQIAELEKILDLEELDHEKAGGVPDPMVMMFRSARQREKMSVYFEKFEEFLVEITKLFLELAKRYYTDDMLIPAVSAKEYINIPEFRSTVALHYRIHVEAQDETLDTKYGKQLAIQHVLQYASANLDKDDIGKMIRAMPFADFEEEFSDLTLDYDLARNDMLAMERGQFRPAQSEDNHDYMLKKLSFRMRQADFEFLPQEIQRLYQIKKEQHATFKAQQAQALIDAKNEFIPVDGPLLATEMYIPNPNDPQGAPRKARLPETALRWLMQKLEAQGAGLDQLESMNATTLQQVAAHIRNQAPGAPGMPPRPLGLPAGGFSRPAPPSGAVA